MRTSPYLVLAAISASLTHAWLVDPPSTADPNTVKDCTWWYIAQAGDYCFTISDSFAISQNDFRTWNPSVRYACHEGLLIPGNSFCVERNWGIPPEEPTKPTPTKDVDPTPTPGGNGVSTPAPIQDGMVSTCNNFYFVKSGDGCATIASKNGISIDDFYKWNPAVGSSCGGLWANVYVCVGLIGGTPTTLITSTTAKPGGNTTPTPIQDGMVEKCNNFYFVKAGDGCATIASNHKIPVEDFYKWNPAVGSSCAGLWANVYVCVGVDGYTPPTKTEKTSDTPTKPTNGITTPTPIQDGMVNNCDKFYFVQSGNGCADIASKHSIAVSDFYKWNPAVGNNCQGLWANVYVCVRTTGYKPEPSPTQNNPSGATPTPIQAGMTNNCKNFYKVRSGDNCEKIVAAYQISLGNFYSWNPSVGNQCQSLWTEYYVCVGV